MGVELHQILRLPEVEKTIGLKRTVIYQLAAKGEFPAPIKLTGRASGWLAEEVADWQAERIRQSRPQTA